ncbi:hypothetical protein BJ508DRAFT_331910, partial [Ascobolus immersus RN42]
GGEVVDEVEAVDEVDEVDEVDDVDDVAEVGGRQGQVQHGALVDQGCGNGEETKLDNYKLCLLKDALQEDPKPEPPIQTLPRQHSRDIRPGLTATSRSSSSEARRLSSFYKAASPPVEEPLWLQVASRWPGSRECLSASSQSSHGSELPREHYFARKERVEKGDIREIRRSRSAGKTGAVGGM